MTSSVLFSFYCTIGIPPLKFLIPFRINTAPEKSSWCIFLVISRSFIKAFWGFFSFLERNSSHLFPINDHSHSTHAICWVYLRHIYVPDTALFKSSHCPFNSVANKSCSTCNTIFTSFTEVIQSLKSRLRYLVPKSFSIRHNHNWLKLWT